MADLRHCSHEFLTEFIETYKSLPCLWQIKSKEYSDRDKKNQAYEILIKKYKEIDGTANRETVVKKINSLRSVYRKELAKVNKSRRSGAGEDDIYKPTLWYFNLFSFLNDQETLRESVNIMDDNLAIFSEGGQKQPEDNTNQSYIDELDETLDNLNASAIPGSSTSDYVERSTFCNTSRSQFSSKKRKRVTDNDKTIEIMLLIEKILDLDDSFDIFGRHAANKLRHLNSQQNMFAQKLINDVLFAAELGSLTQNYKVVDTREPQYYFNSSGNYYGQHQILSQIGQYQHLSQQIGEQQYILPQIGQQQQMSQM